MKDELLSWPSPIQKREQVAWGRPFEESLNLVIK